MNISKLFVGNLKCLFNWKFFDILFAVLFAVFVVLAIRYQIKLLDYLVFGDEAETIVTSKMMASGQKLYSEIFNHHGPLTFLPGMLLELFGDFGVPVHRVPIAMFQFFAVIAIYFSPLLDKGFASKAYIITAISIVLLFFPELFGSMYMYQVIAGLVIVVVLVQYTLPIIYFPEKISNRNVFFGNILIACLPFLAITYVPIAFLLFLSSLRRQYLNKSLCFLAAGVFANVAFLFGVGSVAGYFAFHIYLNSEILSLYNGGQSLASLIKKVFFATTGSLANFSYFIIFVAAISRLSSAENGFPWRSIFLGAGIASLLIRGLGFHGLPYYYSLLAMPLVFFARRPILSKQSQVVVLFFLIICIVKLSLLVPGDREKLESSRNPTETEFSKLAQAFTSKNDKIISYSFNNHEYISAHRLPASGNFFYLPWQEKYNESPKYGIKIDSCKEISDYLPKLMLINKWKVWDSFSWDSYATCIQGVIDREYIQLPGKPYYFRKDIFSGVVSISRDGFVSFSKGVLSSVNNLSAIGDGTFKVVGPDPFFVYSFSKPVPPEYAKKIAFELECVNPTNEKKVPLQFFWRTKITNFSEVKSITLPVAQGVTSAVLSKFPAWNPGEDITNIRIDLFTPGDCAEVLIKNVDLGY